MGMHDETELVLLATPILAEVIRRLRDAQGITPWREDVEDIDKLERSMDKANKELNRS